MALAYAAPVATRLSGLCAQRWDALVIGAGPAGAVAGAVLAARGMRTLILDRREFPRRKVCGGCLAPAGVAALESIGLASALHGAAPGRVDALRVLVGGASARLPIEPYATLDRSRLDTALVQAAVDRGALFQSGMLARVLPDDSVEIESSGDHARAKPRVTIVADGLGGSALASRPDFRWRIDHTSPVGVGAMLETRPVDAAEGEITMACARRGYVGVAPLGGGGWTVAAALSSRLVRESGPSDALAGVLAEAGARPLDIPRGRLAGVGQLTRRRTRIAAGRVLVLGDAAGYVQPLTGEGMSWAIACAAGIGPWGELAAAGVDVSRQWTRECAHLLRLRRLVCRGVCLLAAHPAALRALVHLAAGIPAGWASRRLCWRGA